VAFPLAYEGTTQPSERVRAYALRVLGYPALLANSIVRAKAEASVAIRLATLAR
jgi:hypothetical protein